MTVDLENNVRRAFSEIQERFKEFDSMHPTKYPAHLRKIEKSCQLREGQLATLFGKYCTMPVRRYAQQVYDNRSNPRDLPDIPYKREYRSD